ncbi:4-hydroxyphenylpyruvate dioxygenase-like protein [Callorhinchus milii]|uniref:4-hydroxyphenylpyruvate dioxygenase-like protein n=1 Tax=Callorhinchus milii TaxID=7868 RepID=UPI001C3F8A6D|nr:4-hydroxyphenylpyruvate dioxygenase-like protein [Callorhinchus milii]
MAVVRVLGLSHISFHVGSSEALCRELRGRYGFRLWGSRVTASAEQQVLRKGSAVFIVNQRPGGRPRARAQASAWPSPSGGFLYDVAPAPGVDTAANVCFEVRRVEEAARRLSGLGCRVLVPPRRVEGEGGLGPVTYTVLRSALGNVCHTLVDRSAYSGDFLPGFSPEPRGPGPGPGEGEGGEAGPGPGVSVSHLDHITYACDRGDTGRVLGWYRRCFGFERFPLCRNEDVNEGYVIEGNDVGLRLTAMRYWKCSEVGMSIPATKEKKMDCKFVIAESLPYQGKNQVDTFLQQHHGAGIQHVGLYTTDIVSTSKCLMDNGVQFFFPPPAYYTETSKRQEIMEVGQDPDVLLKYGVLLDAALDEEQCNEVKCQETTVNNKRYLMQVFTKPLFSEDTFFLELIERKGAAGFGEGNIRALWKSLQTYIDQKEDKETKEKAQNGSPLMRTKNLLGGVSSI